MPTIELSTAINAPIDRVFDLARSIDLHLTTAGQTGERAVAGRTSGLIEIGEQVTWQARHFGIRQRLTVKITAYDRPHYFEDRMIKGAFRSMRHGHQFSEARGGTVMSDRFEFEAPLGWLGRASEHVFLTRYMRNFLQERNRILKQTAESEDWRRLLE